MNKSGTGDKFFSCKSSLVNVLLEKNGLIHIQAILGLSSVEKWSFFTFSSKFWPWHIFRFSRKSRPLTPNFFSLNLCNFQGHTRLCRSQQREKSRNFPFLAKYRSKMGQNCSKLLKIGLFWDPRGSKITPKITNNG